MRRAAVFLFLSACASFAEAAPPQISFIGTAASYMPVAALGSIVSIFGSNLSDGVYTLPRPIQQTALGSTRVTVCDRSVKACVPAALLYAAPSQINFVIPDVIPGQKRPDEGVIYRQRRIA